MAALATVLCLLASPARTQPLADASAPRGPARLEVVDGGWGSGRPQEIDAVLRGVVGVFPQAPGQTLPSVRVRHRFGGPQINYDRERDDWVTVYLSARDDRWYQYIYQFAHEYCHLLSRFDRKEQAGEIVRDNQWFEEALCEAASLYALRRLTVTWCGGQGDALRTEAATQSSLYARQLLASPHRSLDPNSSLADWYVRHRDTLRARAYERELNELAATELLPWFEQDAGHWSALAYLHQATPMPGQTFPDFLAAWARDTPAASRPLVVAIQTLFGFRAPDEVVSALLRPRPSTAPGCGS